ncbi:MAG: alpha/beta fold hydrolase [Thermoleophilaceae bacterium]|nr:alpha/beta fold hydrolase [Thermoleophilaceae bacterium]
MTELSSYRSGSGEPLVAIHGFTGTRHNWDPVLPALERRHDVLAVSLLGHAGGAPLPAGTAPSLAALVDGVERDMDAAGFETAHIVGNSLGGWIGVELAKRGRARTLVGIAPAGGWAPGSKIERRIQKMFRRNHHLVRWAAPRARALVSRPRLRALALRDVVAFPERVPPAAAQQMIEGAAGCSIDLALLDALGDHGPITDVAGVGCPVRIVWGTRDRILPLGPCSDRLRELLPRAEFVELPGLGHVPMYDDPERVAQAILDFTARAAASEPATA